MFLDEPEGNSFDDLNQYLGFACALGNAITLKIDNKSNLDAFLYYEQDRLPNEIALFTVNQKLNNKDVFYIKTRRINWFKLRRHGISKSRIEEDGVPASLPLVVIMAKKIRGDGKIINPGTTAIYSDDMDFKGTITDSDSKINEK